MGKSLAEGNQRYGNNSKYGFHIKINVDRKRDESSRVRPTFTSRT